MDGKPVSPNWIPGAGIEYMKCMICFSVFTENDYLSQSGEVVEILSDILKVLCMYMKWVPPGKSQYNLHTDFFPFCKDCRLIVVKIYKFDRLVVEIQKGIDVLTSQLSAKILETEIGPGRLQTTKLCNSFEVSSPQHSTDLVNSYEKSKYYRNSVCRRYFPVIRLIADPRVLVTTDCEKDILVDLKDSCTNVSSECQTSQDFQDHAEDTGNISTVDDGGKDEDAFDRFDTGPFPSLRDRVKKVGNGQFLLDEKCHFEISKTVFKCISCDLLFASKYPLKRHIHDCPGNPSYDVTYSYKHCGRVYDEVRNGTLRCRQCKYMCWSRKKMILHLRKFHAKRQTIKDKMKLLCVKLEPNKFVCNQKYPFELKDERFKCGTCLLDFSTRSEVLSHIQRDHIWVNLPRNLIFVNNSPDKFSWTDPFNKTYSFERMDGAYKCDHCLYSTVKLNYMKQHIRFAHAKVKFICKICERACVDGNGLRKHLNTHADNPHLLVCEFCGQSYKSPSGLAAHKAVVHLDKFDKNYECKVCERAFGSSSHLTAHAKAHKDSVCQVCGKNVRTSYLNIHMRSHNAESTFECKKCDKKFRHCTSLRSHLNSHNRVKPYECDICGMKFAQVYSVTRHKNVVHNSFKTTKTDTKTQKRRRQVEEETSIDKEESEGSSEEDKSEDEIYETVGANDGGKD